MILNKPTCYKCSDYGYTPGEGAPTGSVPSGPGETIKDAGRITLTADTPRVVLFTQISVIDESKWIFAGLPTCYDSNNEGVGYEITNKTGTGFTVTAIADSTFEYTCIKI